MLAQVGNCVVNQCLSLTDIENEPYDAQSLAEALWKVQATRSTDALAKFLYGYRSIDVFLRAAEEVRPGRAKPDNGFGSDAGRKTMDCILSWQSDHGDWPKNSDTTTKPFSGERSKLQGTFDNCNGGIDCPLN